MKRIITTVCAFCHISFDQEISDGWGHPKKLYHNECRKEAMRIKFGKPKYNDIDLLHPKL